MTIIAFDMLDMMDRLKTAGLDQKQSEAVILDGMAVDSAVNLHNCLVSEAFIHTAALIKI